MITGGLVAKGSINTPKHEFRKPRRDAKAFSL
jgi:hypothetical protein